MTVKNFEGRNPLYLAIHLGNYKLVQLMLEHINILLIKNNYIFLHKAIRMRDLNIVKLLIGSGINPDKEDEQGSNSLHILFNSFTKDFAICALIGDELFKTETTKNIRVNLINNEHWAPIHIASRRSSIECLNWIVDRNKILSIQNKELFDFNLKGKSGWTPLHLSVNSYRFNESYIIAGLTKDIFKKNESNKTARKAANGNYLMTKLVKNYEITQLKRLFKCVTNYATNNYTLEIFNRTNKNLINILDQRAAKEYNPLSNKNIFNKKASISTCIINNNTVNDTYRNILDSNNVISYNLKNKLIDKRSKKNISDYFYNYKQSESNHTEIKNSINKKINNKNTNLITKIKTYNISVKKGIKKIDYYYQLIINNKVSLPEKFDSILKLKFLLLDNFNKYINNLNNNSQNQYKTNNHNYFNTNLSNYSNNTLLLKNKVDYDYNIKSTSNINTPVNNKNNDNFNSNINIDDKEYILTEGNKILKLILKELNPKLKINLTLINEILIIIESFPCYEMLEYLKEYKCLLLENITNNKNYLLKLNCNENINNLNTTEDNLYNYLNIRYVIKLVDISLNVLNVKKKYIINKLSNISKISNTHKVINNFMNNKVKRKTQITVSIPETLDKSKSTLYKRNVNHVKTLKCNRNDVNIADNSNVLAKPINKSSYNLFSNNITFIERYTIYKLNELSYNNKNKYNKKINVFDEQSSFNNNSIDKSLDEVYIEPIAFNTKLINISNSNSKISTNKFINNTLKINSSSINNENNLLLNLNIINKDQKSSNISNVKISSNYNNNLDNDSTIEYNINKENAYLHGLYSLNKNIDAYKKEFKIGEADYIQLEDSNNYTNDNFYEKNNKLKDNIDKSYSFTKNRNETINSIHNKNNTCIQKERIKKSNLKKEFNIINNRFILPKAIKSSSINSLSQSPILKHINKDLIDTEEEFI